jgi:hypothetical protein
MSVASKSCAVSVNIFPEEAASRIFRAILPFVSGSKLPVDLTARLFFFFGQSDTVSHGRNGSFCQSNSGLCNIMIKYTINAGLANREPPSRSRHPRITVHAELAVCESVHLGRGDNLNVKYRESKRRTRNGTAAQPKRSRFLNLLASFRTRNQTY